jgi:cytosine/adenosine deaminase-related metal-dependent hydrolase
VADVPTDAPPDATDRYALDGRVVTMDDRHRVIDPGRVYVEGDSIRAVAPGDAPAPDGWDDVRVVRTGDTIYPGLIELHNHLSYNALPLWDVPQRFDNRAQWMRHRDYRRLISGPAAVLGRSGGFLEAVVRYVEAKCLLGGVTTSQGIALASNMGIRRYYRGLVRNAEHTGEPRLPPAATRVADVAAADAPAFLERLRESSSLLLHLAEGVDAAAREHFRALRIGPREWAITPALAGIHCAGLSGRDYQILRARGGSMIWSPLSNLLLYGGTADIRRAADEDLPIALGSDWSPSGSKNLLGELKVGWLVSEEEGSVFTPRELVAMATTNPARILKWQEAVGSIEPGKRADLMVVDGRSGDPYEHLLKARESSVTMVVIDGVPRCGQPRLMAPFADGHAADRLVERRTVGGAERVIDLTDDEADPLIGTLPLSEAETRLTEGLRDLPELAKRLENPITASLALGSTDPTEEGIWFLELDHDELDHMSDRPALGGLSLLAGDGDGTGPPGWPGGLPVWALAASEPLSEILVPVALDPLTVVDDEGYFARLAAVPHLPDHVARELPRFYGRRAPRRPRPPETPAGPEGEHPDASLADAGAGEARAERLSAFLARAGTLTLSDRQLLVDQALVLLEQAYVHLVLKRAMHAVDPVQRLRLLRDRLSTLTDETMGPEAELHRELADIFASVRDLHTNYLLPSPFGERTAFLPFLVERLTDPPERFVVSKVAGGLAHPTFVPEVEVLHWNGVPVRRAIEANARHQGGGNPAASFARGLDALTIRPLVRSLPPDEDWVVITYRGLDAVEREIRLDWQVAVAGLGGEAGLPPTGVRAALGLDLQVHAVNEAKKQLFAPAAVEAEAEIADPDDETTARAVGAGEVPTTMPTVFRARPVDTPSGTFGHVRIFTFGVRDADDFVAEFVRLAEQLPQDGLIVDVRGNGGGLIYAPERLLQVLTPRRIVPEPAQLTTTPLMLDVCERHGPSPLDPTFDLSAWVPSLRQAVGTGARYSNAFPITEEATANAIGQRYHGPIVLVTDALCYSATDIFAAGFQDHEIGPVLGIDDNTGAGGANVWTHDLLKLLLDTPHDGDGAGGTGAPSVHPANPFVELPGGAGFRVSVRRTLRVGPERGGTPLEDLGVEPDVHHAMTRRDVLGDNGDLLAAAGALLAREPVLRLAVVEAEVRPDGRVRVRLDTRGLDRVDVAFDGRPVASLDVTDRISTHQWRPPASPPEVLDLTGWSSARSVEEPVARRRERL